MVDVDSSAMPERLVVPSDLVVAARSRWLRAEA
jgi:hypothetical protein